MSDDTIGRYQQMLAEDPQSRAFAPLAEAHRKAGRLDEAIRIARAGLEIHPGYSGGLVVLGRALYEKGELDNAAETLQKAVSDSPESYLGQKFLGKVLIDKGENTGALRALEAANLLSPEDEEVARLLDEVKTKASSPETMVYDEQPAESDEKAQIVTYEQKLTTIDGVELPPLPPGEIAETFSFSGGGTADPSDLTPVVVDGEPAPAGVGVSEVPSAQVPEEEMTATVIEEEEVEQTMEIESLDELGPEAAAFIQEGEDLGDVSVEDLPDEESMAVEEAVEEVVVGLEGSPSPPTPPAAPIPAASAPAPEAEPAPASMFEPAPEPVFEPAPGPAPEPASEPPAPQTGREDQFSTETMADLYAQQGLIEKASNIYKQILDQTPDNELVRLKLDALDAQAATDTDPPQAVQPPVEPQPEPPQIDSTEEELKALEGLLENVERIKRP
jgi:tetratricopeptide (TPR) repeat protein